MRWLTAWRRVQDGRWVLIMSRHSARQQMPLPARRLEITRWSFGKTLRQICFVPAQAGPARSRAFRSLSGQIAWILPAASVRAEAWRLSPGPETARIG